MIGYIYDDGGRRDAGYKGDTGDCVPRAIAILTGESYKEVYRTMADAMKASGYAASGNAYATAKRKMPKKRGQKDAKVVQEIVMAKYGLVKVKLPSGERPTYSEAHAEYGNVLVSTRGHVCAIVDGELHDIFDGRTYDWTNEWDETFEHERKAMSVWVRRM